MLIFFISEQYFQRKYRQCEERYAVLMDSSANLQGIDVSIYQGTVDWGNVKTAGKVVSPPPPYAKATKSTDSTDHQFATTWAAMKSRRNNPWKPIIFS